MLTGFDKFSEMMQGHKEQFVVIGGTACEAALEQTGLTRRATKDIDMVVVVEELSSDFIHDLWGFLKSGGYHPSRRTNHSGQTTYAFYRFDNPKDGTFPAKIEILARKEEFLFGENEKRIEPIVDKDVSSSLSAIIMDDDMYQLTTHHWVEYRGVHMASPTALVCLKARAYLNLLQERNASKQVNTEDIKKHRRDVLTLLATGKVEETRVPESVYCTIQEFVRILREQPINSLADSLGVAEQVVEEYLSLLETTFTQA